MVNREFCGDVFNRFEYFGFYQKNAYSVLHSTILARGKGLVQFTSFTLLKLLIWVERKGDHSLRELIFVNFLKAVPRKFLGCVCVCLHFVLKVLVFCLFVCFCLRYGEVLEGANKTQPDCLFGGRSVILYRTQHPPPPNNSPSISQNNS